MNPLTILMIFGCILQHILADVSHLEHNNKERHYLPPELDRSATEQVNQKVKQKSVKKNEPHHHHHEQHDNKQDHKNHGHSVKRPLNAESSMRINTFGMPANVRRGNNFVRPRNDIDAQGSELIYAHAPNSLFNTQINVQSQDSDFGGNDRFPNAPSTGLSPVNGQRVAPAFNPNNGAAFPGNGGATGIGGPQGNGGAPDNGGFASIGGAPRNGGPTGTIFGILNFGASNRIEARAQEPLRLEQKQNKQGYNAIHGDVAADDLPERAFLQRIEGNVQGVNVIGGNILGRRINDQAQPQDFVDAATTNLQPSYTMKSASEKQSSYVRPYYDNDDFKYEPSAANAPEVIYKPGDDINFNDVALREYNSADTSYAASGTDLRADGYHYSKPNVAFSY